LGFGTSACSDSPDDGIECGLHHSQRAGRNGVGTGNRTDRERDSRASLSARQSLDCQSTSAPDIGPDSSISISSIAERILSCDGKAKQIEYDTSRPEGDVDRTADLTRAREILRWRPSTTIDESLRQTYQWCETYLYTLQH